MTTADELTFTSAPHRVAQPLAFKLNGVRLSSPEPEDPTSIGPDTPGYWEEEFHTVTALPGSVLDAVSGSVRILEGNVSEINQAQALPILRAILQPGDDRNRFELLLRDPDRTVDYKVLWQASMTLVQKLSGRPTGGSGG